ncbi:MAG: site-specific integrase [Terriglobales bacterium]
MTKHNPRNERIKREYFAFLKEAKSHSEPTVDAAAKALDRFELFTRHRDFKLFHPEQAIAFKRYLAQQRAQRSGEVLSKATLHSTLTQLKRFFRWLAWRPGYKSRLRYSDAEFFNLPDNDTRIAKARREQKVPTLEQIKHVINSMPSNSEIEKRNRALFAFTLLTGARDSAAASMKLKHVDLTANCVHQDAREVQTKFRKTFTTYFFPVGDQIRQIVVDWVAYLQEIKRWGNDDPLFPATQVAVGPSRQFEVSGLKRAHWRNASPIRSIFHEAYANAGVPYFNPHSFRNTLVQLGEKLCNSPEQFKAWSQNLGHEKALTTFLSYGEVPVYRQGEIMRDLAVPREPARSELQEIKDLLKKLKD